MNKIKQKFTVILAVILLITAMPLSERTVQAATGYASFSNLGKLGTVTIGKKNESGNWLKTKVNGKAVFCRDLGKSCHTGYVYESKEEQLSSDSKNTAASMKAKIGYWYAKTKKGANKAWVYAQCLIWGVEEGITDEDGLKNIIRQVRNNTGYYPEDSVYADIFSKKDVVTCDVIEWEYAGTTDRKYVQRLMQIDSGTDEKIPACVDKKIRYRQRITLHKQDEDGKSLSKAAFELEAKNIKELYSYRTNGWGSPEEDNVEDDETRFVTTALTDSKGEIAFRFDYQLQSEDYYYYSDSDLAQMSKDDKTKAKEQLKNDGMKYAASLTKQDAEELAQKDLEQQLHEISNQYLIRETDTGNPNLIATGKIAEGMVVTIGEALSWTKVDGSWPDMEEGRQNYEKAYRLEATNQYKKVKLTAVKKDAETGAAQGNATLSGAVYGIYQDYGCSVLLNRYVTDANGQFETENLRCGTDYYLKEIVPPTGYLKNDTVYTVHEDGQSYTAEYNKAEKDYSVQDRVIKGNVELIKIMTNGAVGITKPEAGAEFQIYLAQAGSYEKAKDTERDYLQTDADGYAKSKSLPYGTYLVHQVKGADETAYVSDFYADIKEDGKTYRYILNNPSFTAYLKIIKKDAQTKKTVLKAGAVYQIFSVDENGNETIVKQSYSNGNRFVTVDKFVSDEQGEILTYEPLKAGRYKIREVQGPEGTFNAGKVIEIVITGQSYKTEVDADGREYKVAECEYFNNETYGKFTLEKKGTVISGFEKTQDGNIDGATQSHGKFTYEDIYLNDVIFELYAKENIVTQDNQGENWFDAGEKVATIITGRGAEFKRDCAGICSYSLDPSTGGVTVNLPLGHYELREVRTLYGYVLPDENKWDLEFRWNSQYDEYVLDCSGNTKDGILTVENKLPQTEIVIQKKDGKTERAVSGAVFGFYSKNRIYDRNGEVIVNEGEKLATVVTDENGVAAVPFSVPVMSKEAVKADGEDASGLEHMNDNSQDAPGLEHMKDNGQDAPGLEHMKDNGLPYNSGDYYFVEESVSGSYFIDKTPVEVHLEYADQQTARIRAEAVMKDTQTEVKIDKMKTGSDKKVAGCHLAVADSQNHEIVSWVSGDKASITLTRNADTLGYQNLGASFDENGSLVICGLLQDMEYTLREQNPADGFATAPDILFRLEKKVMENTQLSTKVLFEDDAKTDNNGDDNRIVMYDDTTKIEFSKIASDTGKLLKGAQYGIYDKQGRKVRTFTTSESRAVLLDGILKVGETYTFVEQQAPEHYQRAKEIRITVKDTGKVQKVKVVDERILEVPDTPQTGRSRFPAIFILFAAVELIAGYYRMKGHGKKKKDER